MFLTQNVRLHIRHKTNVLRLSRIRDFHTFRHVTRTYFGHTDGRFLPLSLHKRPGRLTARFVVPGADTRPTNNPRKIRYSSVWTTKPTPAYVSHGNGGPPYLTSPRVARAMVLAQKSSSMRVTSWFKVDMGSTIGGLATIITNSWSAR